MNIAGAPGHFHGRGVDHGHRRCAREPRARARPAAAGPSPRAARRDDAHFDGRGAREQHVELGRGGVGEVDDAVADERPAVVDAHDDLAAVAQVRDLGVGGNRQRLVRGGHGVHVVALAERGRRGVKARAVPGGGAALDESFGARQHVVALAEDFVERRIAARAARLGARHGIGDREHVGRRLRDGRAGRNAGAAACQAGLSRMDAARLQPESEQEDGQRRARAQRAQDTLLDPSARRGRGTRLRGRAWSSPPGAPGVAAPRRDAIGDGGREIVHRHGVTHAAVVTRDHFEILEAHAVRGPRSAFPPGISSTGVVSACAVSKSTPLDLRPATVSLSERLPGSAVTGASGCSDGFGEHRAAGHPAALLEVVSDAGDDVVPVGEQVALARRCCRPPRSGGSSTA